MHVTILSVMSIHPGLAPPRRRTTPLVVGLLVVLAIALAAVAVLVSRGGDDEPAPAAPAAAPVIAAVDNIDYFVGTNLAVGAYRQTAATPSCTYRVSDPITDELIEESRPGATGPITVNLGKDVKFRSTGCGAWTPAG